MKPLFAFFDAPKRVKEYFDSIHKNADPLARLAELKRARIELDACLRELELAAAKDAFADGYRWTDIAEAAGVTRQTAQATYRDRSNRPRRRRSSARDDNSWPEAFDE